MELLREEEQAQIYDVQAEAQRHNALIREHYARLQNKMETQIAEDVRVEARGTSARNTAGTLEKTTYISPNTIHSSTYAQTPTVTEYISRAPSALFTPERFERMQFVEEVKPISTTAVEQVATPVQSVAVKTQAHYSLSSAAKLVMAAFAVVTVTMMAIICVNTNAINQKKASIQLLEERKAELVAQDARLQQRLEDAKSEETIREYAESQGMVKAEN